MRFVSLDLETSGSEEAYALEPWRVRQKKAWVTTWAMTKRIDDRLTTKGSILQVGDLVDFDQTRATLAMILQHCADLCEDGETRIVGWNMTFDIGWFVAYGLEDLVFQVKWLDAMRLYRHLISVPTFQGKLDLRLETANKKFEPVYATYKAEGQSLYHDSRPEARAKLLTYNKGDTEATLLHCERFWPQLTEDQQSCALTEADCLARVARANVVGMCVDKPAVEKLTFTLATIGHDIAKIMAPKGVTEAIIRSPTKLSKLLYDTWQLNVVKRNDPTQKELETAKIENRTPLGEPSTDKEVLYELGLEDERVANIALWREAINLRTKFMGGLTKSMGYLGEGAVTRPQATIYATYTGRMTYNTRIGQKKVQVGFALHQMKRDDRFRSCIVAPEGYDLVEFDAAGQEFRWMAIYSGDTVMLDLCEEGGDPHSYMTAQIYHWDYDETKRLAKDKTTDAAKGRKLGKVANLSLQYRTYPKRLRIVSRVQYGLPMTEDESKHVWRTYRKSYIGVPIYWNNQIELGKSKGYAETMAGRRVQVIGDWEGEDSWMMESTMINYPIQGTGGEQKYLGLQCLENTLIKHDAHFAWDLHDGLYFYSPKDRSRAFAAEGKVILDNLPYRRAWNFTPPIPMPWDCKIGPNWGNMKEIEL